MFTGQRESCGGQPPSSPRRKNVEEEAAEESRRRRSGGNRPMGKRPVGPTGVLRHARGRSATSAVIRKHGGVHIAAAGCRGSRLLPNFPHSLVVPARRRRGAHGGLGGGRAASPALRVQIQLQRTAPVTGRRQRPVLDPHWK